MALDPNIILQAKGPQFDNPMDLQAKALQIRHLGLQTQAEQQDYQDNQTLRSLYQKNSGPSGLDQPGFMKDAYSAGLGAKAVALQQAQLGITKTQGEIGETAAKTSQANAATAKTQWDLHLDQLNLVNNHISALARDPNLTREKVLDTISSEIKDPDARARALAAVPQDPSKLKDYLFVTGIKNFDAMRQIEAQKAMAPQLEKIDTGPNINLAQRDPVTGAITMGQNVAKGISPDTTANITKDYAVAGLNPDGTPGQANQALVKMIGEGRMIPSDRLESTPRGQAVLAEVEKQYPGYDVTSARAKQKAAYDFGPGGKDATAMRSIGTATKHLDMLNTLIDNLDNTDSPAFNSVANFWKTQTGGTAPKTFDAAKQIVGQEVVKAIVAGGGGVGERQEAADALSKASSPAQLKSVIATYKTIMGAQHESLLQQRDAAGLSRSTLPDYTEGASGKPSVATLPVPIKSEADYAALKSGTRYLAPDGTTRTKQ